MADEKTPPAAGGEGGGDISVADAVKQITTLLPLLQKLAAIAGGKPAEEEVVVDPVADKAPPAGATDEEDPEKKKAAAAAGAAAAATDAEDPTKKKDTAAMDAMDAAIKNMPAAVLKAMAQRNKLVNDLTPHVGAFDHDDMTPGDVVAYGITKLGLSDKAKGHDAASFLAAYLHAKPKPGVAHAHAMDARDTNKAGEAPAFLADYTKE